MYTVLIDEAGDVGLNNVLADPSYGPTQYFCLCATILDEDKRSDIEYCLEKLPFKKEELHANRLNHFEKAFFSRRVAEIPVAMLGVVSNKLSLLEYLPAAQKTPTHFYNKVMQYLLERIGIVFGRFGISPSNSRILLEARAQQYSSLLSFIDRIQQNPLDTRALPIRNIDRFCISAIKKADDKCMAISDLGAHAIFSAVRRDQRAFGLSESRYLSDIRGAFLAGTTGHIFGYGIKAIHKVDDLGLPTETATFLKELRNPKRDFCRL